VLCIALLMRGPVSAPATIASAPLPSSNGSPAQQWFRRMKPYCNTVEADVMQRRTPAPSGLEGAGFSAACFALAGRTDQARRVIDALPADVRFRAAGIVFEVGHPVADAGDDRAAGPIMELVVDYWPDHYMALYHAGMAEYMLGQSALAQRSLRDFLKYYEADDGWRRNAIEVLERLDRAPASTRDELQRPPEPAS